jgi:hypothetical protein
MALPMRKVQYGSMRDPSHRKPDSVLPPASRRPAIRKTGVAAEELAPAQRYSLPAPQLPPARAFDDGEATQSFDASATNEESTRMFEADAPTDGYGAQTKRLPPPSAPPAGSPWVKSGAYPMPADTDPNLQSFDDRSMLSSGRLATARIRPDDDTMSRSEFEAPMPASNEEWNETLTAVPRENVVERRWKPDGQTGDSLHTGDFHVEPARPTTRGGFGQDVDDDSEPTRAAVDAPVRPSPVPPRQTGSQRVAPLSRPPARRPLVELNVPEAVITAPLPDVRPLAQPRPQSPPASTRGEDPFAAYRSALAVSQPAAVLAPNSPAYPPVAQAPQVAYAVSPSYPSPASTSPANGARTVPPPTMQRDAPRGGPAKADSPRYVLWVAYGLLVGGFGVLFGAQFISGQKGDEEARSAPTASVHTAHTPETVAAPQTPAAAYPGAVGYPAAPGQQPGMMLQPGQTMQPGAMQPGAMQPGAMQPGAMQPGQPMQPGAMQPGQPMQPGAMQPGQPAYPPSYAYPNPQPQQPPVSAAPGHAQGYTPPPVAAQPAPKRAPTARPAPPRTPPPPKTNDDDAPVAKAPEPKSTAKAVTANNVLDDAL